MGVPMVLTRDFTPMPFDLFDPNDQRLF
jgi:hypothetical protein